MKAITEEMHLEKEWYKEAGEQTMDTLNSFINHIMNDYEHDYGTVCHAFAACALATIYACDKTEQGGITGFQSSMVMWEIVRQLLYPNNKCGLRMINFDDMLYPQCDYKFDKTINSHSFNTLQNEAKKLLEEDSAHPLVMEHWQSIVDGVVPFGYKIKD